MIMLHEREGSIMYLRKMAERQRMLDELLRQGFDMARDGRRFLKDLPLQDLETEYVRLLELKEISSR